MSLILETVAAFLKPEPFLAYVCGRILLLVQLPAIVYAFVQLSIFVIQFTQIVFTNGIILESKRAGGMEVFVLEDAARNPDSQGCLHNVLDFTQPVRGVPWPALRPGAATDAYCEDVLKYRRLDLKPTILTAWINGRTVDAI
jgi:hypothetical protein